MQEVHKNTFQVRVITNIFRHVIASDKHITPTSGTLRFELPKAVEKPPPAAGLEPAAHNRRIFHPSRRFTNSATQPAGRVAPTKLGDVAKMAVTACSAGQV